MTFLPPKSVVGNNVTTKASHVTHNACRIFGSLWKTKKVPGIVISLEKRIPDGSSRNVTFITVEWTLPGRVVLKELNGRLVEFVPPSVEVPSVEVAVAPDTRIAASIENISEIILPSNIPVPNPISTLQVIDPPTTTQPPLIVPPSKEVEGSVSVESMILPSDLVAQEAHGRMWTINHRVEKRDVNGPIPHRKWYIIDSLGDRILQSDYHKVKEMTRLDLFLLMYPPDHLIKIINLTNQNLLKIGTYKMTKGSLIIFFGIIILGTRFEFSSRHDLWSTESVSRFVEAPRFGEKTGMSRNRFDEI